MGQYLILTGYSSELSEMDEADKLHPNYDNENGAAVPRCVMMQNKYIVMGQYLILTGYSSELSEMDEADKLHPSYNFPHKDLLTPDTVKTLGSLYMIRRVFC